MNYQSNELAFQHLKTPWGIWLGGTAGCKIGNLCPTDPCVVYVLDCGEAGYYVGHTKRFRTRLEEHYGKKGSGFTKKYPVQSVNWVSPVYPRIEAAKLEWWVKRACKPLRKARRRRHGRARHAS